MKMDILLTNAHLEDINPRVCGYEDCRPRHAYGPACRDYYLLHYVKAGKGEFRTQRSTTTVTAGQIFVIRPYEQTTYCADEREPWSYYWIGFDSGIAHLPDVLERDVIGAARSEPVFASLLEADNIKAGREYYLCAKIFELFCTLSNETHGRDKSLEYVLKAKNYIESEYPKEISIVRMAHDLNLDRSYFCHLFKRHVGRSPQQYLVDFRLQKAAELMAEHGYRPGEAAASTGYHDAVNFSRMFKKRYGIPPSVYRARTLP